MDRVDSIVIGAGVVGLAIARALALAGREVLILEREARFGTGISSRNSGVIHAGIYYPAGSLKQRLCIAGRERLYRFCAERSVPHRRCGKLVVAFSDDERARLEALARNAHAAGVLSELLDGAQARALEPELRCAAALHFPQSGIVDAPALMTALLAEAEDHGAQLACHAPVERIERGAGGWTVHAAGTTVAAVVVVNAAGLGAWDVARATAPLDRAHVPPMHLAKGNYFAVSGRAPFTRLIYPLPVAGGLGTHLTLDLGGSARFGPDVEWIDAPDHAVDPSRHAAFLAAARRIWPGLEAGRLSPGYCGIRPKLAGPGEPDADFWIAGEDAHGLPGLVNLFGIESPGLTASLAIGEHVAALCWAG